MGLDMDLFDLSGKTALVSGASRGLGKGMAKALASHNATVILVARSEDGLRTTLNEIESEGGSGFVIPADLSSLKYGVSITDECISWETTERLLLSAAEKLVNSSKLSSSDRWVRAL